MLNRASLNFGDGAWRLGQRVRRGLVVAPNGCRVGAGWSAAHALRSPANGLDASAIGRAPTQGMRGQTYVWFI
jgi:hypothetical protein